MTLTAGLQQQFDIERLGNTPVPEAEVCAEVCVRKRRDRYPRSLMP